MKNVSTIKNLNKYASILILSAMMICGLTACQTEKETGVGGGDFPQAWNRGNMYMGEITAIDGKEITVNVMGGGMFGGKIPSIENLPEGFDKSKLPEGGSADGKTFEGMKPENMPEGFDRNNMPEGFDPDAMPEGFAPESMFEGETMTIKVTKKAEITINGEKGKVSDLQVGDYIQFIMDDDKVTSVSVGMMQQLSPQQFNKQPAT